MIRNRIAMFLMLFVSIGTNGQTFKISYSEAKDSIEVSDLLHFENSHWSPRTGLKDGDYQVYADHDSIDKKPFASFTIKDEKANGPFECYFGQDDKKIHCSGYYKDGKRHGTFVFYDQIGGKTAEVNYANGLREGKAIRWDGPKNQRYQSQEANFKNGKLHGSITNYDRDGAVKTAFNFVDNHLEGNQWFIKKGDTIARLNYVNGIYHTVELDTTHFLRTLTEATVNHQYLEVIFPFNTQLLEEKYKDGDIANLGDAFFGFQLGRAQKVQMAFEYLTQMPNLKSLNLLARDKGSDLFYDFLEANPQVLKQKPHLTKISINMAGYSTIHTAILRSTTITKVELASVDTFPIELLNMHWIETLYMEGKTYNIKDLGYKSPTTLSMTRSSTIKRFELPNMSSFTKLNSLFIHRLSLNENAVFERIKNTTTLSSLGLRQCSIDSVPNTIGYLYNLKNLDISYNDVRFISPVVGKMSKLVRVYIDIGLKDQIETLRDMNDSLMVVPIESCFPGETEIIMSDGSLKRMDAISAGDKILGFDENSKKHTIAEVKKVHTHLCGEVDRMVVLKIQTSNQLEKVLHTTDNHPFYVNGAWTRAGKIEAGDKVLMWNGSGFESATVQQVDFSNKVPDVLYNLTTSANTYLPLGVVVHNK